MSWLSEYTLRGSNFASLPSRLWNMGLVGRVRRFCHKGKQFGIDNLGFREYNSPAAWGVIANHEGRNWIGTRNKDGSETYIIHLHGLADAYDSKRDAMVVNFFKELKDQDNAITQARREIRR